LSMLLGGWSARMKGSMGAWHVKAEEEKGKRGWGSAQRAGKEKKGGPTAQRHVEEESVGGPTGWHGARLTKAVATRASIARSRGASGVREGVGQLGKRRELGRAREKQCGF
jgi:hypothetical protein